jgi:hypothetical protein
MTWALRRRLIILGIIAVVLAGAIAAFYFKDIYVHPSCTDTKQNQNEEGVDCGGPCPYLCTASEAAPSVRFVRAISPVPGRTDVIVYIDNPNVGVAAKGLTYSIDLYDAENALIGRKAGKVDLPPAATVPVYVPNFYSGSRVVAHAFLTFDTPAHLWYRYPKETRTIPDVRSVDVSVGASPRVHALAVNPSAIPLGPTLFIATVFDTQGNALAASQTIATLIPGQGTADLVFTWPSTFSGPVSRVEVTPVIPLP